MLSRCVLLRSVGRLIIRVSFRVRLNRGVTLGVVLSLMLCV